MGEIMDPNVKGICHPQTDKETVANIMAQYNLYMLPIVDERDRLLGIVTHDDVLDIVQAAATADIQQLHGAGADESIHDSVWYSLKKRNPWLIVNLFTALLGATVISKFSQAIEQFSLLAAFMTVIASLGGSAGAQTLAVSIRGLAIGEIQRGDAPSICLREAMKGFINGLAIGLVGGTVAFLYSHNLRMGATVLLGICLNMPLSSFMAALIPLLLKKLNFDPAQSANIFLTAITDICGLFIFLFFGSKWLL
jgi:magnesium transporter